MRVIAPNIMLNSVNDITIEFLNQMEIKALILDVDNTLAIHGDNSPADGVLDWIEKIKSHNMPMIIVSNNFEKRVKPFAKKLGINYISFGCKPLLLGINRATKIFKLPAKNIAIVGDQLFTDMVGGNLKGLYTILVSPISQEGGWFFKLKRGLEAKYISRLQKNK